MTYALDLVRRLSERLLAADLIDNELDLPHDGLRLIEVNCSLDRSLLLCLGYGLLLHLRCSSSELDPRCARSGPSSSGIL